MNSGPSPLHVLFDPPSEVFATDAAGSFVFPLLHNAQSHLETALFDEVRFVFSIWSPSSQSVIDLDRTYVELRASLDPEEEHWTKLAEIEPVVPRLQLGRALRWLDRAADPGFGERVLDRGQRVLSRARGCSFGPALTSLRERR